MLVHSVFVPPDGGEIDYSLDFDLPAVPHAGDYISIDLEGEDGTRDFIVRRTWWSIGHPPSLPGPRGALQVVLMPPNAMIAWSVPHDFALP
jgi:hypothetical protein